jgi:circadian clock protein KaiB
VSQNTSLPQLFKGIALFTPGGDLVYCIDPRKQNRWHLQLCAVLQEMLGLTEPPHFLVPCYSATLDRWLDPHTQTIQTVAEAYPLVMKHQALLNAIFEADDLIWREMPRQEGLCDPLILATYQQQFPQLWQDHDLIVQFEQAGSRERSQLGRSPLPWSPPAQPQNARGYVLRLFVSGNTAATERILQSLHRLFETSLKHPYTLKVIDVHVHPEQAEIDHVTATPTLVKIYPEPVRRIVGDLDDVSKILRMLGSSEG